jgi:predicted component of type VI protein secretion system
MEILLSIESKHDGTTRELKRELGEGLVVGRGAEEGILLDGSDLSREHLIITADSTHIYVTDLSNNGTWLNGTRIRRSLRTRVRPEDKIEIPGYILVVKPAAEPVEEKSGAEVAIVPSPAALETMQAPPASVPSGPMAFLRPVSNFIGSFTFMEKFSVFVACLGLLLLYSYFGS